MPMLRLHRRLVGLLRPSTILRSLRPEARSGGSSSPSWCSRRPCSSSRSSVARLGGHRSSSECQSGIRNVRMWNFCGVLAWCDSTARWPAPIAGAGLPNSALFNEVQYASSVEARSVFFVLNSLSLFQFDFRLPPYRYTCIYCDSSPDSMLKDDFVLYFHHLKISCISWS